MVIRLLYSFTIISLMPTNFVGYLEARYGLKSHEVRSTLGISNSGEGESVHRIMRIGVLFWGGGIWCCGLKSHEVRVEKTRGGEGGGGCVSSPPSY